MSTSSPLFSDNEREIRSCCETQTARGGWAGQAAADDALRPLSAVNPPLIHFRGIYRSFATKVVYRGLEFAIHRGETLTILGPSGSGKSVMLKMLIGLLEVDRGEIFFDGRDVTKMS